MVNEKILIRAQSSLFSFFRALLRQSQGPGVFDKWRCCDIDLIKFILAREGFPRGLRSDYRFGGSRPTVDSVEDFL